MTTRAPAAVRFALPPSLGTSLEARGRHLKDFLSATLQRPVEVHYPTTYEQLARELLAGKVDAAWAPPFVCARIEAMGVRVLVRGVRNGASAYRAALLKRADSPLTLASLGGSAAAWSDRDSVGGYLLPLAFLREKGLDAGKLFSRQDFAGNYRKALEQVAEGTADLTSVFAPPARPGMAESTGVSEVWPEKAGAFSILAFTEEAPNDGVAVSMSAPGTLVADLERVLLGMHASGGGEVLTQTFHADRFELAPRMGYRALYRVALASL